MDYRYGHKEQDDFPLAAWIWGHRMRIGQHWMEYLLEFLNVLAGFDYEFGQGVTLNAQQTPEKLAYHKFSRLGLRRFVFYDEKEKSRHAQDEKALIYLKEQLGAQHLETPTDSEETLGLVRDLLQAFSAIEEQRSWYAKSLFPAHNNLLFWEGLRRRVDSRPNAHEPGELDVGISLQARNFFARGGELYYLILSAATEDKPEMRVRISKQFRELLYGHNRSVGKLAELVDNTWLQLAAQGRDEEVALEEGKLGWLPDSKCALYSIIADDIERFLDAQVDPLETMDLLAHLVAFHLTLYIYHRANPNISTDNHALGNCRDVLPHPLLIDVLSDYGNGAALRQVSAILFQEQEQWIVRKAESFIEDFVKDRQNNHENLQSDAAFYFSIKRLSTGSREPFEQRAYSLDEQYSQGGLSDEEYAYAYSQALTELLMQDFNKNFRGVHRKLGKSVGFIAPKKGQNARFVLEDNLLKALTLANVETEMIYDEYLALLYQRYGLVVGAQEARKSGLFDRHRINADYYDRNRLVLLNKLQNAGLAREYSDATAMIQVNSET